METKLLTSSPMRQAIGRRMLQSKPGAPHFYAQTEIPVDALRSSLDELNRDQEHRITVTHAFALACARTLVVYPAFNAIWTDEGAVTVNDVNLGIAIALDDGLVAPAIIGAQHLDLARMAKAIRDLVQRARTSKLRAVELAEGTFTLSNLGMFDVSAFTAIITPPQVATLAIGSAQQRLALVAGEVLPTSVVTVTMSADHRVVDGRDSALWLETFKSILQDPLLLAEAPATGLEDS